MERRDVLREGNDVDEKRNIETLNLRVGMRGFLSFNSIDRNERKSQD